jgi:hypothetical protein
LGIVVFCELLEKELGPLHVYELDAGFPNKINNCPIQTGALLVAVGDGAGFITTFVVPVLTQPPTEVTVTTYGPAMFVVLLAIVGFCALLVNAFGPVHVYELAAVTDKFIVCPAQYGPVLFTVIVGVGLTTTTTTA